MVALLLLNLSVTFNTWDHKILLDRLQTVWGIQDMAFGWFKSYLSGLCQFVQVNKSVSKSQPLSYGVLQGSCLGPNLQGSCLGPKLFLAYIQPLSAIIQYYADDTQHAVL